MSWALRLPHVGAFLNLWVLPRTVMSSQDLLPGAAKDQMPNWERLQLCRPRHGQQALVLGDPWSPGSKCVLGVCGKLPSCSLDPKPVTHLYLILFLALCPPTGHLVPGVSQNPRYYITEMGWDVTLRCDPMTGHLPHSGTDRPRERAWSF